MIPFSAGSTLDIVGRIVLDPLSSQLGQPIVIENRGGAGGTIGAAMVAKAEPDGYTILVHASAHSAAPAAYPNMPYDPARDFSAVIPFGTMPNVTVIAPSKGIKTVQELVAAAKARPAHLRLGRRRQRHPLGGGALAPERRIRGGHVPFRGGPEALTEVMTGRVDFFCIGMSAALAADERRQARPARREHAQALVGAAGRADDARGRLAESDYKFWIGMFVPAKTPREIVDRLYRETEKALRAAGRDRTSSSRRGSSRCR